jgi:hypothetical protein
MERLDRASAMVLALVLAPLLLLEQASDYIIFVFLFFKKIVSCRKTTYLGVGAPVGHN